MLDRDSMFIQMYGTEEAERGKESGLPEDRELFRLEYNRDRSNNNSNNNKAKDSIQ